MPLTASYDPNAPSEQPVSLPSAPLLLISETEVVQPPLTRRGTGPGIILVLPHFKDLNIRKEGAKPLDPEPVQKWAEEGFAVAAITPNSSDWFFKSSLKRSIDALLGLKELDTRDKFAVIVYDSKLVNSILPVLTGDPRIVALVIYGTSPPGNSLSIPTLIHLHASEKPGTSSSNVTFHTYTNSSPYFVLPRVSGYDPGSAALSHSRSLVFLRKRLGGPIFDLEAIWEEHTYFEFEDRSVAKTMGTMVMTGGVGRENLTTFYRDHFIFSSVTYDYQRHRRSTDDLYAAMQVVSRTLGPDRIVGTFTHDRIVDWLLPGVPPSGKKLTIPMIAVVNIRGDRLYNEHIWWDQATALRQAHILPTHLPFSTPEGEKRLRLPIAGAESAAMLADEANGKSNIMFGNDWGLQD
ncbi:hypothetical protein C0995_004326 [Termitomyces sp. Mi166|nr:hypothetical protein C0995_004326 [Termitomyces sp. Mi166\